MKLNLGCGNTRIDGFLGIDIIPSPAVDKVCDLNSKFPFEDSSVEEVVAQDILEHLVNPIHSMNEIWRVCKNGALVKIVVPSTDGRGAFQDPTHKSFWNENSFMYYCIDKGLIHLGRRYGFNGSFKMKSLDYFFCGDPNLKMLEMKVILEVIKPEPIKLEVI